MAQAPNPTRVISSPLQRARQTAEHIGLPVEIDERWIEVDYGIYDGVELGTPASTELWERWRIDTGFVPPGGESLEQMGERMEALDADIGDASERVESYLSDECGLDISGDDGTDDADDGTEGS